MKPTGPARVERRLAAILAADVAGYSRLMGADEEGTLERLKALRRELLDPKIAAHHGRIVKTTGDGLLVEFASGPPRGPCRAKRYRRGCRRTQQATSTSPLRTSANRRARTSRGQYGSIASDAPPYPRNARLGERPSGGSPACAVACGGREGWGASAPRQAVDCRASLCQSERRSGAEILCRRHGRGDHHRAQPHPR